jgi:hypothetical protein
MTVAYRRREEIPPSSSGRTLFLHESEMSVQSISRRARPVFFPAGLSAIFAIFAVFAVFAALPATAAGIAAPAHLTATPLSTTKVHLAWNDRAANETEYRVELAILGDGYQDIGGVPADSTEVDVDGLWIATGYRFRVRARNVSGYSGYSNEATAATSAPITPCVPDAQTLCLNKGRFRAEVDWKTARGLAGTANVVVTSDTSGLVSFFDPGNFEMIVKVLDGCSESPPRFWVFLAAATNLRYLVTVTDTQTGAVKAYFNPLNHSAAAVTETGAFATCP